jgi:hypothetical protein
MPLPLLGTLLALAEASTHWSGFRWAGYALTLIAQFLAWLAWLEAKRQPPFVPVLYRCPRCNELGDLVALRGHRCALRRVA